MTIPEPRAPKHLGWGRVTRALPLAGLTGRAAGEGLLAAYRQRYAEPGGESVIREFHMITAQRYAELLGGSRGVLLKVGQVLATLVPATLVDAEFQGIYRSAFGKMLDEVPAMTAEAVTVTIEAELGKPITELFGQFDPDPLAAASIGQVHSATLADGRRVAVKVQYPGAQRAIQGDLRNVQLVVTMLRLLASTCGKRPRLDLAAIAREVAHRVNQELDYRLEARNHRTFADAYRGHPFIHVPEVVPELSTARVLTTELAEGLSFQQAVEADQKLRDAWGEAVFRFSYCGLRRLHMANSDLNPGNFLFRADGSVAFLDFGCVIHIGEPHVHVLFGWLRAVLHDDAEGLQRWARESRIIRPGPALESADVLDSWRRAIAHLVTVEPLTIDHDLVAEILGARSARRGLAGEFAQALNVPPDLTFALRLDVSLLGILAGLRATCPWGAIIDELGHDRRPATALGELDADFWAESDPSGDRVPSA